jgi:hypothetical protein
MRPLVLLVLLSISASLCTGCATFSRGSHQTVKLITEPSPADVYVDGAIYTSPAEAKVKRNKPHTVVVTKPGYQGIEFKLKARWDAGGPGAVALDAIVPGGSVMFAVDTVVGADREFSKTVTIKLPPATQPNPPNITLWEYKGQLLQKAEYDAAVERDKWFAKNKKKGKSPATTQASAG